MLTQPRNDLLPSLRTARHPVDQEDHWAFARYVVHEALALDGQLSLFHRAGSWRGWTLAYLGPFLDKPIGAATLLPRKPVEGVGARREPPARCLFL